MADLATIAAQYIQGDPSELTPRESRDFAAWLESSYRPIAHLVQLTSAEVSPETFLAHWQLTGKLLISTAFSDGAMWSPAANAKLRAVHDWHHLLSGQRFDWEGEVAACNYACSYAPDSIKWILRSEILGQAAACLVTGEFQPQKLVRGITA